MKKNILFLVCFISLSTFAQQNFNPYQYKVTKSAAFKRAAVSCAHPLASEVGLLMLKKGGNAFDAAIATQLTLAVVYPGAGNLGGGGFLLGRTEAGKFVAIDFREEAPAAATENMYLDSAGNVITEASIYGHLAAGVPASVSGIFSSLKYCKLSLKELIQPAIDLAEKGFVIMQREADGLNSAKNDFVRLNPHPEPFVKSTPWKAGDTLIQKDLAETLKRIQQFGQQGFYSGKTAKLIAAEMQRGKGLVTENDLKNYKAKEREVLKFNYRGYDIVSFPPPSSGGIIIAQMLKMIQKYPVSSYGFQSTRAVQLMTEAERRAYADRSVHMGDPDYYHVPLATLLNQNYLDERMKDYDSSKAGVSANTVAGEIKESKETTHISVVDEKGNMVSITTTLNGSYGSRTIVEGAGFILNNEMDDFSVKPGVANMYGAIGGKANAIAPHKRMLSSMAPTLVMKNNKPFLVLGTPGGTTIPTSVFQTIVNVIDFKMPVTEAVAKPKFHHQWLPDEIDVEPGFNPNTKTSLEKMGYKIVEIPALGRMEVLQIDSSGIHAAADPRGDDSVSGQ